MCGICGWIDSSSPTLNTLVDFNRRASHRGPDGEGYWLYNGQDPWGQWFGEFDVAANQQWRGQVGLGHRRLAILDLSSAGLQPMSNTAQTLWVVFNGEIYNYLELRAELQATGHVFRTHTDTEVILAAYTEWGTNCFRCFNGMWGLALVDLKQRKLILSRDRLGVKPLYYWFSGRGMAFSSEIKQLLAMPGFNPKANPHTVVEFIDTGYEILPETFFQDVQAFPPGCFAEISLDSPGKISPLAYWSSDVETFAKSAKPDDVLEKLRFLFEDAVRLRLRSDVPVGVCLSGGLDSSLVYGQIQALASNRPATHAFSASYIEKQFDESSFVREVITKHGGQVHYAFPSAKNFLDDFDLFIYHHDEPPGGMSQYAAWDVMKLARQHAVPVLLNGQGGDELFSGYWPAYFLYLKSQLPLHPARVASHLIGALLPQGNLQLIKEIPAHLRQYFFRQKRLNREFLYPGLPSLAPNWASQAQNISPETYRQHEVTRVHLPRLLKWDDRNSMTFAVEGRYPFLDYRLVEFALSLPVGFNLRNGWNKYLLRTGLGQLLPPAIQWRRTKIGFVTPQSQWMQITLKPILREWLSRPSEALRYFVDMNKAAPVFETLLRSYIHPMDERQHALFRLFALDKWFQCYGIQL